MILDLTVFEQETLDIKMSDERTLRIPKPSQKMVIRLQSMRNIDEVKDPSEVLVKMDELTLDILNSNIDGVKLTKAELGRLSVTAKTAIVQAYGEFIRKLQANPT